MPPGRNMSKEEMSEGISALEQALYMHEQWTNQLYCSLICRLPADERDLADAPHRRCHFGQWYYAQQETSLGQHPGFVAVAAEHEQMHRDAAYLLLAVNAGQPIPVRDYERFTNDVSRLRAEILSLRHELEDGLTNLDLLTGATTRIGMLTKLRAQQEMVKRELHPCSIAMMDLDLFKDINDRYGHQAGDTALTSAAQCVLANLRPYDECFRYGGEEFFLSLPGTDIEAGHEIVERLRSQIAGLSIDVGDGRTIRLTASFGLTLLDPDVPVEESIARADQALYKAKDVGRNQTCRWDPSLSLT